MATASSSEVRSASVTWRSQALATMHTTGVSAETSVVSTSSRSARTPARRVDPKATRVAVLSRSSRGARAKNSLSLGLAPGQPPSM